MRCLSAWKSLIPEWHNFLTESLPDLTALTALGAAARGAALSDLGKLRKSGDAYDSEMPQSQKRECGGVFERYGVFLCDL